MNRYPGCQLYTERVFHSKNVVNTFTVTLGGSKGLPTDCEYPDILLTDIDGVGCDVLGRNICVVV